MSDTIAAVATGSQVSAIGIVRISGAKAIEIVDNLFKPKSGKLMSSYPDRTLVYGDVLDTDGKTLDICLCTISRAPNTYTGEDTAEFQCHGSPTVLRKLLDNTFLLGARQAGPGEFTKRAFLNGRMDLTQAEAVVDIIDAETAECAKNAAGQLGGAIQKKIETVYTSIIDICAHYHAVLDYPDEDIEPFVIEEYKNVFNRGISCFESLLSTFSHGKLLKSGVPVAIIGRPNAGKSSLLNAILGYDRAIVTDIPGTTRDTIEEKVSIFGMMFRFTDTAGIRDSSDKIEQLGIERSRQALDNSELVIAVIDGSNITNEDLEIANIASQSPKCVIVLSKLDLQKPNDFDAPNGVPIVPVSSVTGEGLSSLEHTIKDMFPDSSSPSGEILTNSRQADAVSRALDYMKSAYESIFNGFTPDIILTEAEGALSAIGELTGRTISEDITNQIFSRFCVGK